MTAAINRADPSATTPEEIARHLKDAFRSHPAGVAVVTADPGDGPVGLTATSVSSVSVDPPAVAFSLSAASTSAPRIRAAEHVVIHLLSADQLELAQLFATSGVDRFADTTKWGRLPTGEPYLLDAGVWLRGRITGVLDINGSILAAVEIVESRCRPGEERTPLVYWNRSWHQLSENSTVPKEAK
ncbi:flavin reductase family protein [Corynebacterium halotolerans]|uniref:flavin reductase family protein n=1 Tax=Corynebacterium halotolerans TaxID=225326 RepID=UPI003CF97E87